MDYIQEILFEPSVIQAVIVLSLICATGLYLGRIRILGISLGVTFVFFVGILAGHLGLKINKDMLDFAQNFGLIIFVYTLGLQVGPGFFSSLKKGGVKLNLLSLSLVALGLIFILVLNWTTRMPLSDLMGLLSGSVTNTPMLGAAQQALLQMHPDGGENVTRMALACAVAYPLGVIGVILAIIVLKRMFAKDSERSIKNAEDKTYVGEYHVSNPAVFGKTIKEIMLPLDMHFVISRIWHDGKVSIPASDTRIQKNDHLLIISGKSEVDSIMTIFGEQENIDWNRPDIDWNAIDSLLVSRHVLVTNSKMDGVKLGSLRLRNAYGINITRVNRNKPRGITGVETAERRPADDSRRGKSHRQLQQDSRERSQRAEQSQSDSHIHRAYPRSAARFCTVHDSGNGHADKTGACRRSYNNRHPHGRVRVKVPSDDIYHPKCQPYAATVRDYALSCRPGTGLRGTFFRDRILQRRSGLDRAGTCSGRHSGTDNRNNSREILQGGLCPKCGHAMRKHGQPYGPQLCQLYSKRG